MIKKSIFVVLAMFGFNSVADMHTGSDHMSDMMSSSGDVEEAGLTGAVELKSHVLDDLRSSYRLRMGWKGDVNEQIQWGASVSSGLEQAFATPALEALGLSEAYVSYKPVEGLSFKAGKYNWRTDFNRTGVLYDDDIHAGGVAAKYHHGDRDSNHAFAKVALYNVAEVNKGPYTNDTLLKVKVGGHYAMSEDMVGGAYASVEYDGLFKADDNTAEDKTLAQAGVNLAVSSMAVPVGFFGVYVTDVGDIGKNHSFNAGVYVGKASTPHSDEAGDFGVSVSYYDINEADHNTTLVDTDYIAAGTGKGIAARAQYNVWDNTNIVAKYVRNMAKGVADDAKNKLVAELTFNF